MKVNQSGRSMIEMLGVLAIVGVLSVGALAGYSMAMSKHKANKAASELEQIVFNVIDLYETANIKDHKSITRDVLVKEEMLSEDFLNIYGEEIEIASSNTSVLIKYKYPDKSACINMLSSQTINDIGEYLTYFVANSVVSGAYGKISTHLPLSVEETNVMCSTENNDFKAICIGVYFAGNVNLSEIVGMSTLLQAE